jgi:hypothetical protein
VCALARADRLLDLLEQGRLEVRSPDLKKPLDQLNRTLRGLTGAVLFAAFLFSAVQLSLAGQVSLSRVLGAAAALCLGWILLRR